MTISPEHYYGNSSWRVAWFLYPHFIKKVICFLIGAYPRSLFPGLGTNAICEAFIVDQLLPDLPCELNSPSPLSAMRTGKQNIPPTAESRK